MVGLSVTVVFGCGRGLRGGNSGALGRESGGGGAEDDEGLRRSVGGRVSAALEGGARGGGGGGGGLRLRLWSWEE